MPNRTIQILGVAYGSSPTSMTATWNGNQIFSGTVSTQNTSAPTPTTPLGDVTPGVLFSFEIPMDATGNYSMTTNVENNTVLLGDILANYCNVADFAGNVGDPWYKRDYVSTGANGFGSISSYQAADERSEVSINGNPQSLPNPKTDPSGAWWFILPAGSSLACQVSVQAGLE